MSLDPVPLHVMPSGRRFKRHPEFLVLHRLAGTVLPALLFPAVDPAGNTLADVLRIGIELDPAWLGERVEGLDSRSEFHLVIGDVWRAAEQFFLFALELQDSTPATRAGIALAGPIGIDRYRLQRNPVMFEVMRRWDEQRSV